MKRYLTFMFMSFMFAGLAKAQDMIVTNDGESIKAFNLEIGPKSVFYQLSMDADADTKRIDKKDILIIRLADGTKLDPNSSGQTPAVGKKGALPSRALREPVSHEPQTAKAISYDEKKGQTIYTVQTADGHYVYCRVISNEQATMSIAKGKYTEVSYVLPEYVEVEGKIFTVTEIDDKAFMDKHDVTEVVFPLTLKKIGNSSFQHCKIRKVLLPEGLESLGDRAFFLCIMTPRSGSIEEIYLPTSLKSIGSRCFTLSGTESSPGGLYQSYISCLPTFITDSNCSYYGIDDRAVREYKERIHTSE